MDTRTLLRSVVWAAVGTWGGRIVSIALFVILTRLLPAEAVGAMALVATYLMFLQIFGDPGLSEFIVKHPTRDEYTEYSIFWVQFGLATLLGLGLWLSAPWVAKTLSPTVPGEALIRVMSFLPPLGSLGMVAEALLRKRLAFRQLALRSLMAALVSGAVGVVAAYNGLGVWSLVIKQFLEVGINVVALLVFSRWHPKLVFDRGAMAAPLRFGSAVFGTRLILLLHNRIDTLAVGWLLGSAALGYYSIAQRAFQIVSELLSGVAGAVGTPLMAQARTKPGELGRGFLRLVRGGSTFSMPAYAILAACAPLVIDVVFGPQWGASSLPLTWLCIAGVVAGPMWFNGSVMQVADKPGVWMGVVSLYIVAGAILMPIGSVFGISGVAAAVLVRALVMAPLSCRVALKAAEVTNMQFFQAWRPSLLIAAIAGATAFVSQYGLAHVGVPQKIRFAAVIAAGGFAFLLSVALLSPGVWAQLRAKFLPRRA